MARIRNSSHSHTTTAEIFPRKAQSYSTSYSARHGAIPLPRLSPFGAATEPRAVAVSFCTACTVPFSASLFCRTLHRFAIYLKF